MRKPPALMPVMPASLLLPTHEARTLRELAPVFLRWFALVRRRAENTVRAYEADLNSFLAFCDQAGLRMPDDVRVQHVEFFMGPILHEHQRLSEPSINRRLQAIRAFYAWLLRDRLATDNPAKLAFRLREPQRLPRHMSIQKQERLLETLARDEGPVGLRDYAVHATALLCGLRCSELSILQLDHVDLEAGTLTVVQSKGKKDRLVPVIPRLAQILERYITEARPRLLFGIVTPVTSPYLFVRAGSFSQKQKYEGQPLVTRAIYYLVRRTIHRILGEEWHPHALRHSFASRVRENGGAVQDLQEAMGHALITTTARYAHLLPKSQRERMAGYIEGPKIEGGQAGGRPQGGEPESQPEPIRPNLATDPSDPPSAPPRRGRYEQREKGGSPGRLAFRQWRERTKNSPKNVPRRDSRNGRPC